MTRLTKQEKVYLTEKAKRYLLDNSSKLTQDDRMLLDEGEPRIGYYCISGKSYAQYFVTWELSQKIITVSGIGNITDKNILFDRIDIK